MKTISFEQALELMLAAAIPLPSEIVELSKAQGRVLAQSVKADCDMPPFDKSAMDGFACRRVDLATDLEVVEEIPAGCMPSRKIDSGECARIMTGAPVPEGADCVVMVEQTEVVSDGRIRVCNRETADNICRRGEDLRAGDAVLDAGEILTPAHVAVLASVGCALPRVACRPRVTVLATGNELVEPDAQPTGAQIRNSNSHQLCAQLEQMGACCRYGGIVEDTVAAIDAAVKQSFQDSNVLLLSGGVSMGDFDLVPEVLVKNGFVLDFESVAMQPGRPTVFGRRGDDKYCCGLPGNPVSTFVVFELLMKPFLYRLMGARYEPRLVQAVLGREIRRRAAGRQSTIPVRFVGGGAVEPLEYHGSAHISAMTQAQALLIIPAGQDVLPAGAIVHVRPLY